MSPSQPLLLGLDGYPRIYFYYSKNFTEVKIFVGGDVAYDIPPLVPNRIPNQKYQKLV